MRLFRKRQETTMTQSEAPYETSPGPIGYDNTTGDIMMAATEPEPPSAAEVCERCGAPLRTDSVLLNESLALVAERAPELIAEFYARLFEAAPHLRSLFPADMTMQQEKLLGAVVTLARVDLDDDDARDVLDSQLTAMGRAHTRFEPAATIEEYAAVGVTMLGTLADFAGASWNEAYAGAWRRRYEYAAGKMLVAQSTKRETGRGRRRRVV